MPIPQQKFREAVFQIIYSVDAGHATEEAIIALLMKELSITKKSTREALERAHSVQEKQSEIDTLITKISDSYRFERIQNIELNILRLAIYELVYDETIPPKVAIAEAIRLTRKFGTPEAASFINALLDNIYQAHLGHETSSDNLKEVSEALTESEEIANKAALEEE